MITGISKVVVLVDDQESAKEFWTTRVGFELRRDESYGEERWIEVSPPHGGPLLVLSPRAPDEPRREVPAQLPHSPVFFNCADIETTYRELRERGVEFSAPPQRQHFGWWSLFEDPDGTRYALGQWDWDEDIVHSQFESDPEHKRLEALVGRWHTAGRTSPSPSAAGVEIDATDTYEWLPGGFGLLHTVEARVGDDRVEGAEVIGYDPSRGAYLTQYFGTDGPNSYEANFAEEDGALVWRMHSERDRFTGIFDENGTTITGHWELLSDDANWRPWMDITLKKN